MATCGVKDHGSSDKVGTQKFPPSRKIEFNKYSKMDVSSTDVPAVGSDNSFRDQSN